LSEFERDYARRRRYQNLLAVILLPTLFAMRFSMNPEAGTVFGVPLQLGLPAVLMFIVGSTVFSLKNWRCPACTKYLGGAFRGPRHCPNCGVKLRA
jgi:hypothetical protein